MSSPEVLAAVIGGLCTLLAAAIGVRRGISRNRRPAKARGRLRLACPHVEVYLTPDGDLAFRALPITPFGSVQYFCGFCGGEFHQPGVVRIRDDWLAAFKADPHKTFDDYREAWDSACKARKKYERLGGERR